MSRIIAIVFLLLASPQLMLRASDFTAAGSRPHIIMVHVDDMGFGDLSTYGREDLATPRLDQMAEEGARLSAGYAPHPSCIP